MRMWVHSKISKYTQGGNLNTDTLQMRTYKYTVLLVYLAQAKKLRNLWIKRAHIGNLNTQKIYAFVGRFLTIITP